MIPASEPALRDDYVAHIKQRFATARVETDPFPYLVLEDVLPPALYAQMENDIPCTLRWIIAAAIASVRRPWKEFKPRKELNHAYLSQPVISLNARAGTPFLQGRSRRWKKRYFAYIDLVHSLVVEKFSEHSKAYLKQLVDWSLYPPDTGFIPLEYEFCFRTKGWNIAPHTHNLAQALQWMIYFPLPGSVEEQGTQLYRLKKTREIPTKDLFGTTWFIGEGEMEHAALVPYRKNSLICFLNTPRSVHGSDHIPGAVARRYLFVGEWFNKPHNADGPGKLTVSADHFIFKS